MKRIIISICIILLLSMKMYAYNFMSDTKFGVELGPSIDWINTSNNYQGNDEDITAIIQLGTAFNLKVNHSLSQLFNIQGKIGIEKFNAKNEFKEMLINENNEDEGYIKYHQKYSLSQFNLDLKAKYELVNNLGIGLGGYCSLPLNELKFQFISEALNDNFQINHSKLNRPFAGISGELSYDINRFYITLDYKYGLNHMVLHGKSIGLIYDLKPRSINLLLGCNL